MGWVVVVIGHSPRSRVTDPWRPFPAVGGEGRPRYFAELIAMTSCFTASSEVLISPCRNLVTTS